MEIGSYFLQSVGCCRALREVNEAQSNGTDGIKSKEDNGLNRGLTSV